jgi:F5/8 type C domain
VGAQSNDAAPTHGTEDTTGYRIVRGGRSANSGNSRAVFDGDPTTVWLAESSPELAYVWVDLGRMRSIGEIRWLVTAAVPGVEMTIAVSSDKKTWEPVATVSEFTPGDWQAIATAVEGRFVRFSFANPEGAQGIGYLAEVEVGP